MAYLKVKSPFFLNKFLKHVFNFILELNNHLERKYEINFLWKKRRLNQWFWSYEKSSKSLKETFFNKNSSSLYVQKRPTKRCVEIFFK